MTSDDRQAFDPASPALDFGPADDFVESPVASLSEYVGTKALDQAKGGVRVEPDDPVDTVERGDHLLANYSSLNRPIQPLGTPDAPVVIDSDDETIPERASGFEASQVAHMKEIEASIGEDDAFIPTLGAPDCVACDVDPDDLVPR